MLSGNVTFVVLLPTMRWNYSQKNHLLT